MSHLIAGSDPGTGAAPNGATQNREDAVVLRPRAARIAGYAIGGGVLLAATVVGMLTTGTADVVNTLMFILFGLAVFWFCHRQASVSVTVRKDDVVVRNLFGSRTLTWAEIFAVEFPYGDPWARLDLTDGDTLGAMAIQRTDGEYGLMLARRLQRLVRERGEASEPPARS